MSLRYLLDTDIISAPVAPRPNAQVVRNLERHGDASAISAPVWHELNFGVQRLPAGKRQTALAAYVGDVVGAGFPILPYDARAAAWHARERARLERAGSAPPFVDGQIAAIASTNGLILVTANQRHYESFDDLRIENWLRRKRRSGA